MNEDKLMWILLVAAMVVIVGTFGAFAYYEPESPAPMYGQGQMVESKVDGRVGMVIECRRFHDGYRYDVRFGIRQSTTRTHVLVSDEPIKNSPYSVETMRGFELRGYRPQKEKK